MTLRSGGQTEARQCFALVAALCTLQCQSDGDGGAMVPARGERDGGWTAGDAGEPSSSAVSESPPNDAEVPSLPEGEPEPDAVGNTQGDAGRLADAGNGASTSRPPDASVPSETVIRDGGTVIDGSEAFPDAGGVTHSGGAASTATGGNGGTGGFNGDAGRGGSASDGGSELAPVPTFDEVHAILSVWCTPCHDENQQEGGRKHGQLDIDAAYANIQLLGAGPIATLVASRLMPPSSAPNGALEQGQIDRIVAWVNAGAPR